MLITHTEIYKLTIPMQPFVIATATMNKAENLFIKIYTDKGIIGKGECSAFPVITGETQSTCFEMAKQFAFLWKGKQALHIEERMKELHAFAAYNYTVKSAFDMALYDIAAQHVQLPLYKFLNKNAETKTIITDLTIGIGNTEAMAEQAKQFVENGVTIIKVKLGKNAIEDVQRIKAIRSILNNDIVIRTDANQGWSFDEAVYVLNEIAKYNIQFCEQPLHVHDDHLLPALVEQSPVPVMADESVFTYTDAQRLINYKACSYINIKFAKSGGIYEAIKVNKLCEASDVNCMIGGMLESRFASTAFAHFATAFNNVKYYDLDTSLLGHKIDPVSGGIKFNKYQVVLPDNTGIGADIDEAFLKDCEKIIIK